MSNNKQEAVFFDKKTSKYSIEKDGRIKPVLTYRKKPNRLVRHVDNSHYLGKFGGYAIHKSLLDVLIVRHGEETELLTVKDKTGEMFIAKLGDYKNKGTEFNYGYGNQICLPVVLMKKETYSKPQ